MYEPCRVQPIPTGASAVSSVSNTLRYCWCCGFFVCIVNFARPFYALR